METIKFENEKLELTPVTVVETSLPEILKAEIDVQISTAKAYPRSLKMFQDRALTMATLTEDIAETCSYALPRAGKVIEGPTIRLAEIIISTFGNIRSGARIIGNDGKSVTAQGFCHDLETNNFVAVEVKKRITYKDGRTFNEDMQIMTGNAAAAVALRNAIFKVVPMALIMPIYEKAKEVAKGTAETLITRRNKAVAYFNDLGVKNEQICEVLEIKKIEDIDLDRLMLLTQYRSAIKNGEATIKTIFEPEKEELKKETPKAKSKYNSEAEVQQDLLKGALSTDEAEKIIAELNKKAK